MNVPQLVIDNSEKNLEVSRFLLLDSVIQGAPS